MKEQFVVFKEKTSFSKELKSVVDRNIVTISFQDWKKHPIEDIVELKCQELNIKNKKIYKSIENIGFPNLLLLGISYCSIESIEGIRRIAMPCLSQFYMIGNYITKIRELSIAKFPSINRLAIHENKIIDGETLTLSCYSVKYLSFDLDQLSKVECENASFILKLFGETHYFWIKSQFRISQKSMQKALMRKKPMTIFHSGF